MTEIKSPIAVFDSGIGGLTVLRALKASYPHESYVYLGDTARLPYGTKSPETVIRYSETLCRVLLPYQPKAIVIACSTASTHAEAAVQKLAGQIPVVGVIEPTAEAAIRATKNNHIAVIGTFGTIRKGAYENSIRALASLQSGAEIKVSSRACQMLVSLAEEGWSNNAIARATIHEYLDPLFDQADAPDTLILGCTHFPVFAEAFREILGGGIALIDSGEAAAHKLEKIVSVERHEPAHLKILATDDAERFAANAAKFFDVRLKASDVEQVDVSG